MFIYTSLKKEIKIMVIALEIPQKYRYHDTWRCDICTLFLFIISENFLPSTTTSTVETTAGLLSLSLSFRINLLFEIYTTSY